MAKIIIITNVTRLSDLEILQRSKVMIGGMDTHKDELSNIPVSSEELQKKIDFVEENQHRAQTLRAEANELEQKTKQELFDIRISLKANISYVEKIVNETQNKSLVPALGLKTREKNNSVPPNSGVPQAVSLQEIPHTRGTLKLKFKSVKGAKSYGIVWAYGNTSPESFSKQTVKIITSSRNAILSGLESGKTIWVRIKSYCVNNIESDWSDVASRIVP
ncbi:MAG: hypothetical protein JNM36_08420 [Chitinophagales bacterium]|nr:hypothetical protein [Chitinophagales bacterium]